MLIGVVGKPSAGKSTFFKAATQVNVATADYPFTTIKPNHAVGYVRVKCVDQEFNVKCNPREGMCKEGTRFVPVELLDVAGLVPGAHEGKGMGNQFLDDLRQGDCLIHVVDASGSTNEKGERVKTGSHDPLKDVRFLEIELDMWYYNILNRAWPGIAKTTTIDDAPKALSKQFSGLGVTLDMAKKCPTPKKPLRAWTEEELKTISTYFRKQTKPIIIVANKADTQHAKENIERLKKEYKEYLIIPSSAESEVALREADKKGLIQYTPGANKFTITGELNEKQKTALEFIQKNVLDVYGSTGVQEALDQATFTFLQYIAIFPGGTKGFGDRFGNILPDCFLLPPNSTTLDFAYKLHKELGDKFIKAIDVRTKRVLGKEHELKHRDIIEIVSQR